MKVLKTTAVVICAVIVITALVGVSALISLNNKTKALFDNYTEILSDEKYSEAVYVGNTEVIKQDISCGYAVIEMFSQWAGKNITEESLYETYGKVVTSTGKSFCGEMNKQFPEYKTRMYKYLPCSQLIDKAYESLAEGVPVPFEWAAEYEGSWTLHYSMIVGMDIPDDEITVLNPYGYEEKLSIDDFLARTSYEAYEDLPVFMKLGFAFGIFEKNTIFVVSE